MLGGEDERESGKRRQRQSPKRPDQRHKHRRGSRVPDAAQVYCAWRDQRCSSSLALHPGLTSASDYLGIWCRQQQQQPVHAVIEGLPGLPLLPPPLQATHPSTSLVPVIGSLGLTVGYAMLPCPVQAGSAAPATRLARNIAPGVASMGGAHVAQPSSSVAAVAPGRPVHGITGNVNFRLALPLKEADYLAQSEPPGGPCRLEVIRKDPRWSGIAALTMHDAPIQEDVKHRCLEISCKTTESPFTGAAKDTPALAALKEVVNVLNTMSRDWDTSSFTLVLLNNQQARAVIGPKAANIKQLREKHSAHIINVIDSGKIGAELGSQLPLGVNANDELVCLSGPVGQLELFCKVAEALEAHQIEHPSCGCPEKPGPGLVNKTSDAHRWNGSSSQESTTNPGPLHIIPGAKPMQNPLGTGPAVLQTFLITHTQKEALMLKKDGAPALQRVRDQFDHVFPNVKIKLLDKPMEDTLRALTIQASQLVFGDVMTAINGILQSAGRSLLPLPVVQMKEASA